MDYNDFLLNYYINVIAPITVSEWFHSMIRMGGSSIVISEFAKVIISYLGEDKTA